MENLTVIIPIHTYDELVQKYLEKAINSVINQKETAEKILIVGPEDVIQTIKEFFKIEQIEYVINTEEIDYCNQINTGVKKCSTKYFSILGFDDEYSQTWFKNVDKYIKNMPDFSVFLPIVNFINKDNNIVGTANEVIWAMSFSNELGVIDEDTLESYYDFSVCGGIFRTDDFIYSGMLKPSIKLSFWYEFLLRTTNLGFKVFVIPKNGYFHLIDRENSLISSYNYMTQDERAWWIKLANKEHYFKIERKKEYEYVASKDITEVEGLK